MKKMKILTFAVAAVAAFAGVAATDSSADGPNNMLLVNFSTKGPDCYAGGEARQLVQPKEWYALVWSENGVFGGFTSGCRPLVEGDRLLMAARLAKPISAEDPSLGCHCPEVMFNVRNSEKPVAQAGKTGCYYVLLLDTRGAGNAVAEATEEGLPARVNGYAVVADSSAATSGGMVKVTACETSGSLWSESVVAGVGNPEIVDFTRKGNDVFFRITKMDPTVRYNIFGGKTVDKIDEPMLQMPISSESNDKVLDSETSEVMVGFQNTENTFFRVGRQPAGK